MKLTIYTLALLVFSFSSCKTNILPECSSLTINTEKEIGMSTFNIFDVDTLCSLKALYKFPINNISKEKYAVKTWHSPTSKEIEDILLFFNKTQKSPFAKKLLNQYVDKRNEVAYIHIKRHDPPGGKDFYPYNWIELFFLDAENMKLLHLRYGKF